MHVVATAGHVDHGKSTLVRALTGMEPDRWAEERRRGLTIDLGYAWTRLPGGDEVAFVDVPGHERFIANMLAGLGPVAAVLFVVAADAGWSRQSEEHLRAIEALDVRHGLVAVTRSDLADPAPALAEARERVGRSSLGSVETVAVSGATSAGLTELRLALERVLVAMPRPDPGADVRLWLDRSFSVKGAGTVVTATLPAGRVAVGDRLELHGELVTVRGIESLGIASDQIVAPARVALNLRGVGREAARRGDTLVSPGRWHWTSTLDVRLDRDDDLPAELMLHVGTAGVPVHVRPLSTTIARLTLRAPLPVRAGDRAVLRDPGTRSVAAGVKVLDADPPGLSRRGAARARGAELAGRSATSDLAIEVARRGHVPRAHLQRLGVETAELGEVRAVGSWLVSPERWQCWVEQAGTQTRSWAEAHPLSPAMPIAALRKAIGLPDEAEAVGAVVAAAHLHRADGAVRAADQSSSLGPAERAVTELVARLTLAPFAAPERDQLAELGLGRRELAAAERAGALVRISDDIVLLPSAVDRAIELLTTLPARFTTSQARQALASTRRVTIPLLEHLDRLGRTERLDASVRRVVG